MRPKFPIVPEGGTICQCCGRFYVADSNSGYSGYFCEPCGKTIEFCGKCSEVRHGRKHLKDKHNREEHYPAYSIDLV